MATVATRAAALALAVTVIRTTLLALPLAGDGEVIVTKADAVEAVHGHPAVVLSVTLTVPPAAGTLTTVWFRPKLHCEPHPMSANMPFTIGPGV